MKIKELLEIIKKSDLREVDELISLISTFYPFTEPELDECSDILDWGLANNSPGVSNNTQMTLTHDIILRYKDYFNWWHLGENLEERIEYRGQDELRFDNIFIGKILPYITPELKGWTARGNWKSIMKIDHKNLNFTETMLDIFNETVFQMMIPFTKDYLIKNRFKFVDHYLIQNEYIKWDDELVEVFKPFCLRYKIHKIKTVAQIQAIQDKRMNEYELPTNWCITDPIAFDFYMKESRLEVIEFLDLPGCHSQKFVLTGPDLKPIQIADCDHNWLTMWNLPLQTVVKDILKREYNIDF